jgi:hypothetical protein
MRESIWNGARLANGGDTAVGRVPHDFDENAARSARARRRAHNLMTVDIEGSVGAFPV